MCLGIGNKVAVLDDVIKGIVVKIVGNEVTVKTEDMTFVFQKQELVKIEEEQHNLTKFSDINNPFLKDKLSIQKKKKIVFTKEKKEVLLEVDLHIEKLVKSIRGLDNYDILNYQLAVAKKKIEYCILKRISKIVFIHGVGEGILKTELQFLLNNYPVKYYDASYKKYGLGAMEVYVFQNK